MVLWNITQVNPISMSSQESFWNVNVGHVTSNLSPRIGKLYSLWWRVLFVYSVMFLFVLSKNNQSVSVSSSPMVWLTYVQLPDSSSNDIVDILTYSGLVFFFLRLVTIMHVRSYPVSKVSMIHFVKKKMQVNFVQRKVIGR